MSEVRPLENLYAAQWKSAVSETLAKVGAPDDPAQASAHQARVAAISDGTDRYCDALTNGDLIEHPGGVVVEHPGGPEGPAQDSDPEIAAYLAQQVHHRLHLQCASEDAQVRSDVELELKRFTFGNPLWQQMSQQYFANYALYPFHKRSPPAYRAWNAWDGGRGDLNFGVIAWRLPANATVAVVGDIGTGTDIAAATLLSVLSFKPDAILHVGDVYYSGTRFEFEQRLINMLKAAMVAAGHAAPFFTVPGNHEYFTGNVPYFECLDSGVLAQLPNQRQSATYFCLQSEDGGWQFLGMDTGYYGHYLPIKDEQQRAALALLHRADSRVSAEQALQKLPANYDMVLLRDDEAQWQRHHIETFRGQSVLLSHHPLYSQTIPCGIAQSTTASGAPDPKDLNRPGVDTAIWRQLGRYFGEKVPAWFWGHEHNLAIYQAHYRPADWPNDSETRHLFKPLPFGRCIGHSAIPVAATENPYAEHYPVPLTPNTKLSLTDGWYNHGFEILQLAGAGRPLHATYYQISGTDPTPLPLYQEDIT